MSTKHTPGPWKAEDNNWEVSTVYSATGNQIAKCYIDAETEEDTQEKFEPIKEANARLIAAAPELLSCLIEMVEVHDEPCHLDHHGCCQSHFLDDVNEGGCRVANARAAIAKATGGQHE